MQFLRAFLILWLAMFATAQAIAQNGNLQSASKSVVRVAVFSTADGERRYVGHGSGVVVSPNRVVTNAHVVAEQQFDGTMTFMVIPSAGNSGIEARILDVSPENDLALIELIGGQLSPAALVSAPPKDGADVYAIGYPANVDMALQDSEDDNLHPQSPVKTRGNVSTGRTSKAFDSILHTAPIAPGSSGGPLVDSCGRVVGVNSFGATSEAGGAEFYFAISVREILAFLKKNGVAARQTVEPCQIFAEINPAERKRDELARAKIIAEQVAAQKASEAKSAVTERLRREAEYDVIEQRDGGLALSILLLFLSALACGSTYHFFSRNRQAPMVVSAGLATALAVAALFAWMVRPGFDQVEPRLREKMTVTATP